MNHINVVHHQSPLAENIQSLWNLDLKVIPILEVFINIKY